MSHILSIASELVIKAIFVFGIIHFETILMKTVILSAQELRLVTKKALSVPLFCVFHALHVIAIASELVIKNIYVFGIMLLGILRMYIYSYRYKLPLTMSYYHFRFLIDFCCGNLILHQKRNENDKNTNFLIKNNKKYQKKKNM